MTTSHQSIPGYDGTLTWGVGKLPCHDGFTLFAPDAGPPFLVADMPLVAARVPAIANGDF